MLSAELMTGESLLRAEERGPSLVCVSAVPPRAGMHTRVLCKRLRARFPQLPLVAGLWVSEEHAMGAKRYAGMVEGVSVDTSLGGMWWS